MYCFSEDWRTKRRRRFLTFRKTGGFLNTPTPGGVPVRNTSPGYSVTNLRSRRRNGWTEDNNNKALTTSQCSQVWTAHSLLPEHHDSCTSTGLSASLKSQHQDTYCETHATSFSVLKISWSVLLSWTTSPLTRQRIPRLWTSELKTTHCSWATRNLSHQISSPDHTYPSALPW